MSNPLIRRLNATGILTDRDRAFLQSLCERPRAIEADCDLARQGDPPGNVLLILEGFAACYRVVPTGKRQILSVLVPGDFSDLHVAVLGRLDHSITTLTPCSVVEIPCGAVQMLSNNPRINRALCWASLVDLSRLREALASLGQRDAIKRMAHFFCELHLRLQTVGLADENSCPFVLTQPELADVLALTTVHVNRTLQELRNSNAIVLKHKRLTIVDVGKLRAFCDFDPSYLQSGCLR